LNAQREIERKKNELEENDLKIGGDRSGFEFSVKSQNRLKRECHAGLNSYKKLFLFFVNDARVFKHCFILV